MLIFGGGELSSLPGMWWFVMQRQRDEESTSVVHTYVRQGQNRYFYFTSFGD